LLISALSTQAEERRQVASHEHGVTAANIAIDGSELLIELESPAMNIVGFEHSPGDKDQQATINEAIYELRNGAQLFGFPVGAGCTLDSSDAAYISDSTDAHEDHSEHEPSHSGFFAEYTFECTDPGEIDEIRMKVFTKFPLTTVVEASFVSDRIQTYRELTADSPILLVKP